MKIKEVTKRLYERLSPFDFGKRTYKGIIELSDGKVAVSIWDHFGNKNASVALAGTKTLAEEIGMWGCIHLEDYLHSKYDYKTGRIVARFISELGNLSGSLGFYDVREENLTLFNQVARGYVEMTRNLDSMVKGHNFSLRKALIDHDRLMKRSFEDTQQLKKELKEQEESRGFYVSEMMKLIEESRRKSK